MLAMKTTSADAKRDTKPAKPERDANLSPDGKGRSFPKVPNLVQYVSTGAYFGRVKLNGKIFRESLKTDVHTTAKLLLGDFIRKKHKRAARPIAGTVDESGCQGSVTLRNSSTTLFSVVASWVVSNHFIVAFGAGSFWFLHFRCLRFFGGAGEIQRQ